MNAVLERYFMEVHEEAKGRVEQLPVAQELSFVDRKDGFHGFGFHDQALIDVNIQPEWLFKGEALVLDGHDQLAYTGNLAHEQFADQTLFINAFQQAQAFEPMDLKRGTNGLTRPGVGSFIVGMHELKEFEQTIARERNKKTF